MFKGAPRVAMALGVLGLIPFVALAVLSWAGHGGISVLAREALAAYGATILSFLGGVYWGFALAGEQAARPGLAARLSIGVLPQLVGWVAVLLPFRGGQALTAAALLVWLLVERRAVAQGAAPGWFMQLRLPLTLVAAACLAGAAL